MIDISMGRRFVPALLLAASLASVPTQSARAQVAPPFEELLRQTADAPRQVMLDADVDRARALADQARARPNPTVSLTAENIVGQSPYSGLNRAETTLQVNQPIELGGKRSARMAAGQAALAAASARANDSRVFYAYELARAYAAAEIAHRKIALAEDELEEANEDLRVARALVAAGKEARLRSLRAESEANALRAEMDAAEAAFITALARLSALAGVDQPFTSLGEPLLGRVSTAQTLPVLPNQTSGVLAAEAEREAAAAKVVVERKRTTPDITASLGVRRFQQENAQAVVAGISVPLHIFDRNRGNIAAAQAELRAAQAREAAARLEAQTGLRSAERQLSAANGRVAAAERSLRSAQEGYRLARIAYEAGKSPLMELIAARRSIGQARAVVLEAQAAQFDAQATFARLQGRTVTGDPVQ
jgi:cobalt-zinc-cadmium efflux system outer membrane protein